MEEKCLPRFKRFILLLEAHYQCGRADILYDRLESEGQAWLKREEGSVGSPGEMIHLSHAILNCAGIISRVLFGTKSSDLSVKRASQIRKDVGTLPDTPLLKSRKIRNSFEHIDERIDKQMFESEQTIEPIAIGDPDRWKNITVLRGFNPKTMEVFALGDSLDLSVLIEEIRVVATKVRNALNSGLSVEVF